MPTASATVLLVGFQDQGNLGIGYLASALVAQGHQVEVVDVMAGRVAITRHAMARRPDVIGFSIIFQYYVALFGEIARALRAAGVEAHLTAGGHFPTLCPAETFEAIPDLDSIVRFEGEATLVELAGCIARGLDWRQVAGLAYRSGAHLVTTPARPLATDLDALPWPHRPRPPEEVLGFRALPLLASRGCPLACSFCSIHVFYGSAEGRRVRVRDPAAVVAEMRALYDQHRVRIYLFQDDDFPIRGSTGRRWVRRFTDELARRDLVGQVIWKISCRADEVEPGLFAELRDAGLYLVYVGLESGSAASLEILAKRTSVAMNCAAAATLREVGLVGEYGFMLFDPATTFASIRDNVEFLRRITADGSGAATFCRMLPYGGTPIRARLRAEGRLKGGIADPDYDFLDPGLGRFHRLLTRMTDPWTRAAGLSHELNWAWNEVAVIDRLVGPLDGHAAYRADLADLTRESNAALLGMIERCADRAAADDWSWSAPDRAAEERRRLGLRLVAMRDAFVSRNQAVLLAAIGADR